MKARLYCADEKIKDITCSTPTDSRVRGFGGDVCIVQLEDSRRGTDPVSRHELEEWILFSVNGKCGYPLEDALKMRYTGLDGGDEKVPFDLETSISLGLDVCPSDSAESNEGLESCSQWPPYGKWTRQVGGDSLIPCMAIDRFYRFECLLGKRCLIMLPVQRLLPRWRSV